MVKSNALECPCGIWAHKTCLPIEYSPKCGKIWTCDKCSNIQFPIYTAWINLNDVDEYLSVLGVIKGSHALKGFQCRYECRKVLQ